MKESFLALKQQLLDSDVRGLACAEPPAETIELLHIIAVSSSDEEWLDFASEDFSLDAMPPILLNSNQMRTLRGGALPSAATLLRVLPHK